MMLCPLFSLAVQLERTRRAAAESSGSAADQESSSGATEKKSQRTSSGKAKTAAGKEGSDKASAKSGKTEKNSAAKSDKAAVEEEVAAAAEPEEKPAKSSKKKTVVTTKTETVETVAAEKTDPAAAEAEAEEEEETAAAPSAAKKTKTGMTPSSFLKIKYTGRFIFVFDNAHTIWQQLTRKFNIFHHCAFFFPLNWISKNVVRQCVFPLHDDWLNFLNDSEIVKGKCTPQETSVDTDLDIRDDQRFRIFFFWKKILVFIQHSFKWFYFRAIPFKYTGKK